MRLHVQQPFTPEVPLVIGVVLHALGCLNPRFHDDVFAVMGIPAGVSVIALSVWKKPASFS